MTPLVQLLDYVDPMAACAAFGESGDIVFLDSAQVKLLLIGCR